MLGQALPNGNGLHRGGPLSDGYAPQTHTLRMSHKLFDMTPDKLPPDLADQVTCWLERRPIAVRSHGCSRHLACRC